MTMPRGGALQENFVTVILAKSSTSVQTVHTTQKMEPLPKVLQTAGCGAAVEAHQSQEPLAQGPASSASHPPFHSPALLQQISQQDVPTQVATRSATPSHCWVLESGCQDAKASHALLDSVVVVHHCARTPCFRLSTQSHVL